MDWIEGQINDEAIFPVKNDVPFPKTFTSVNKKILTRLYRVFVHVYVHHFDRLMEIGKFPCQKYPINFINFFLKTKKDSMNLLFILRIQKAKSKKKESIAVECAKKLLLKSK